MAQVEVLDSAFAFSFGLAQPALFQPAQLSSPRLILMESAPVFISYRALGLPQCLGCIRPYGYVFLLLCGACPRGLSVDTTNGLEDSITVHHVAFFVNSPTRHVIAVAIFFALKKNSKSEGKMSARNSLHCWRVWHTWNDWPRVTVPSQLSWIGKLAVTR